MTTPRPPWGLLRARPPGRDDRVWLAFERPLEVLEARAPEQVLPVLRAAEEASRAGRWAVGFIAYEAAPAFDRAFRVRPAEPQPLAWFAVFERARERLVRPPAGGHTADPPWVPIAVDWEDYERSIERILELIAAGDTYQVNYTWRLAAPFDGDPWPLFHRLTGPRPPDHASYLDTGDQIIASASPELFFRLEAGRVTCRPMKGTIARGRYPAEDRHHALTLFDSPKNRAENLMIVDMVRNDLGRIADPGSVTVESLFDLERHDTVFQLTSTVTATTRAGTTEILEALFPCASVTGAPKVRTMEIIADLERSPRGVYTGAIGYFAPDGHAEMAVAIRTAWIDRRREGVRYGTGGGIVADSEAGDEYAECHAKTRVLRADRREFELLETLLWSAGDGYRLLDRHLERLTASADYFGFRLSRRRVESELRRLGATLARDGETRRVVRLLASRDGGLELQTRAAQNLVRRWRLALAAEAVDRGDRFLYHKTTRRDAYEQALAGAEGYDDVLLWNDDRELTESCLANVAVKHDGVWRTPPVAAGLLDGCERRELLARGDIEEGPIRILDLVNAEDVALLNSVRGWIPVAGVKDPGGGDSALWRNPTADDP